MKTRESIVFVGAHPDDSEGFAATAFLLCDRYDIHVVDLTRGELGLGMAGLQDGSTARRRIEEEKTACAKLGATPHFLHETDGFACAGKPSVDALVRLFDELVPRAVFTHWPVDSHVDHVQTAAVVANALRFSKAEPERYFFEVSLAQTANYRPLYKVDVTSTIARKLEMLACYACQNKGGSLVEHNRERAEKRGRECGVAFAETFTTNDGRRIPGGVLESLGSLCTADAAFAPAPVAAVGGVAPWRACVCDDGGAYFRETVMTPAKTPVSFTYDGKEHVGFGACKVLERMLETKGVETIGRLRVQVDETLVAELEGAYRADFGESEWVLWFENPGKVPSKTLSDVVSMRYEFEKCSESATCPRLRGIRGDHGMQDRGRLYSPYETDCWNLPNGFWVEGGSRPTHHEFPYFNMYLPDRGILCAIGWAGNWRANFDNVRDRPRADWLYRIRLSACPSFSSVLLPGERIRSARVVLIPHKGSDIDHVSNLWRAWFRKYNEPKWNAAGEPLRPFTTAGFALDTGKPNSDGSISEGHDTWKPTLEKIVAEKVVPEFRWFDAGWYFDPRGQSIPSHWYDVGSWELDTVKWPDRSFRKSVDAGLAVGMKTLVWFEPERVCDPEALATNYGYRTEWALPYGECFWRKGAICAWNNLGDPDCLEWTTERVLGMMDANAVDFYREDHNWDPGSAWEEGDRRAEAKLKLPRRGMTETRGVMGHWALWDAIVEHGRQTNRCTFVDSCASGGGRNDLESLRRGFPLMRSDADRTTTGLRLSMTASFCRWIPFHGSSTKETTSELVAEDGPGASTYVFRSSFLPICNYHAKFVHNKDLDYDLLRRNLAEWRSVADLLLKDFYVLTSWHEGTDVGAWTAFAYDDPEKGESIVLAFRQENAPYPSFEAQLKFADPKATYEIVDADSGKSVRMAGEELRTSGYLITLPQRKSSTLLRIRRSTQV